MLHKLSRNLRRRRIIERTISVHALITVLQHSVTKHVINRIVLVIPHKRDTLTVLVRKSILHDCTAIATQNVIPRSPASKIVVFSHFDFLPP